MSLTHYLALAKRFVSTIKDEGTGAALRKVRLYLSRVRQNAGASILGRSAPSGAAPDHYLRGVWADMARGGGFHAPRPSPLPDGIPPRIALIGDLNLPQCRKYRIEQLADFWKAQGIACDYSHYEDLPRCAQLLQDATHLCEYRLEAMPTTQMFRYEARRLGLPVLYDIDDPLFSVSAYETYHNMAALDPGLKAHFLSVAPRYAAMMNSADMVTVSTPGLVEHAKLFTPRPVYLRRNFADTKTLADGAQAMRAANDAGDDGLFRVVFASGSQGHEADFEIIADAVNRFVMAAPERRLLILGHFRTEQLPDTLRARSEQHEFLPYDDYLTQLAAADVALMPLQDDIFNRCKSAVRVIDAASVGLASVVSDVGDLPSLIEPGKTGYVAHSPSDWTIALEDMARNRAKTRKMGKIARETLENRWSAQAEPHIVSPEILSWIRT